MSKADYETWVTRKGRRHGKPYVERRPLNVPWAIARGTYEDLSDLQLREFLNDMKAEVERRAAPTTNYDPFASQIRRPQ